MLQVVAVLHVLLAISLIGLILMHSGRDTGFGGMGFTPASQGGTHIVERNLTRLTVAVAVAFAATTVGALPPALEPGPAADAGDVEVGGRDRRHAVSVRPAVVVEVARVDERRLARQAEDLDGAGPGRRR